MSCISLCAAYMNGVLLEQMKLQDDLNNIMISSYADTLRIVSRFCCANFPNNLCNALQ